MGLIVHILFSYKLSTFHNHKHQTHNVKRTAINLPPNKITAVAPEMEGYHGGDN